MFFVRCPYCPGTQGRCTTTASGRHVTECSSCGRVIEERHSQTHHLFLLRAHDTPLPLVTPDLASSVQSVPSASTNKEEYDEDPFHPTGFITAFSTWSLEPAPVFARSSYSFSGHLAELERAMDSSSGSSAADPSGPMVSVDHLRAYLQILDVSSILGLDHDVVDHAFQLFRDCCSATCLRNRSIEALATAALVHAIREAQEPRTLQEISTASNLPQKEIGKYIKILGEALKLSQPINSNSISVHMPRFCNLLQLNKSAQELAAHIGEVVINKCFCTRRNPISISAAAIYLACQLEDKRKTQAEICKVTGLTEVTLRKVYKELLENWDDLLPPNYTPAVPPEKAFPMTAIASSGRSAVIKAELMETPSLHLQEKEKKLGKADAMELDKKMYHGVFWQRQFPFGTPSKTAGDKDSNGDGEAVADGKCLSSEGEVKVEKDVMGNDVPQRVGHAAGGLVWHHRASLGMPESSEGDLKVAKDAMVNDVPRRVGHAAGGSAAQSGSVVWHHRASLGMPESWEGELKVEKVAMANDVPRRVGHAASGSAAQSSSLAWHHRASLGMPESWEGELKVEKDTTNYVPRLVGLAAGGSAAQSGSQAWHHIALLGMQESSEGEVKVEKDTMANDVPLRIGHAAGGSAAQPGLLAWHHRASAMMPESSEEEVRVEKDTMANDVPRRVGHATGGSASQSGSLAWHHWASATMMPESSGSASRLLKQQCGLDQSSSRLQVNAKMSEGGESDGSHCRD